MSFLSSIFLSSLPPIVIVHIMGWWYGPRFLKKMHQLGKWCNLVQKNPTFIRQMLLCKECVKCDRIQPKHTAKQFSFKSLHTQGRYRSSRADTLTSETHPNSIGNLDVDTDVIELSDFISLSVHLTDCVWHGIIWFLRVLCWMWISGKCCCSGMDDERTL